MPGDKLTQLGSRRVMLSSSTAPSSLPFSVHPASYLSKGARDEGGKDGNQLSEV